MKFNCDSLAYFMDTVLLVNYLKPIICLPVLSAAVEFAELTVTVDIPEEEPLPAKPNNNTDTELLNCYY